MEAAEELLRKWPWHQVGSEADAGDAGCVGQEGPERRIVNPQRERGDAPRVVVLAGVCLRSDDAKACVRVVGLLPGAAKDVRLGDVVVAVGAVPKCGGEVTMRDVRRCPVDAWPESVLAAASERNASFRLLIARQTEGRDSVQQVDIAQVDLAKLKEDCDNDACRARTCADLCALAESGDADVMRLLLQASCGAGQSVEALFEGADETPLILAARSGRKDCVRCLLQYGADPARTTADAKAALYWAALEGHLECIQVINAAGADVNARDVYGFRALHGAALHGHSACLRALLEMGADVDAVLDDGKTAAYLAAMKGHIGCLKILQVWRADFSRGDALMGFCPVQAAVLNGRLDAVIFLSNAHGGAGPDPTAVAASSNAHGHLLSQTPMRPSSRLATSHSGPWEEREGSVDNEGGGEKVEEGGGDGPDGKSISPTRNDGQFRCAKLGDGDTHAGGAYEIVDAARTGAARPGLHEFGRQSACLFAAMIGKLDAARNTKVSEPEDQTRRDGRENLGVGITAAPHRVLVDISIGYLATCYLASTVLSNDVKPASGE